MLFISLLFPASFDAQFNMTCMSCVVFFFLSGDTLYYRFISDMSNTEWGYKFTVTGGYRGRFQTGTANKNTYAIFVTNWLDTQQTTQAMFRREPLKTGATKNRKVFPLRPCTHRVLKQSTLPLYTAIKGVVFSKDFTPEPALRGAGTPLSCKREAKLQQKCCIWLKTCTV